MKLAAQFLVALTISFITFLLFENATDYKFSIAYSGGVLAMFILNMINLVYKYKGDSK